MVLSVKGCKLSSGAEIIGRVSDAEASAHNLSNGQQHFVEFDLPCVFAMQRTEKGMAPGIFPYVLTSSATSVRIKADSITTEIYDVSKEIADAYLQQTTGIEISSVMPR